MKGRSKEEGKEERNLKGSGDRRVRGKRQGRRTKKRGENIQGRKGYLTDFLFHRFISRICLLSKYMC